MHVHCFIYTGYIFYMYAFYCSQITTIEHHSFYAIWCIERGGKLFCFFFSFLIASLVYVPLKYNWRVQWCFFYLFWHLSLSLLHFVGNYVSQLHVSLHCSVCAEATVHSCSGHHMSIDRVNRVFPFVNIPGRIPMISSHIMLISECFLWSDTAFSHLVDVDSSFRPFYEVIFRIMPIYPPHKNEIKPSPFVLVVTNTVWAKFSRYFRLDH